MSEETTPPHAASEVVSEAYQKIPVPENRRRTLETHWKEIYNPIVFDMKLAIRYNPVRKCVELKTTDKTERADALQRSAEFVRAFTLGFEPCDAAVLLRLDGAYVTSFDILDVKTLHGEHLARAIGRIAGRGGSVKYTIENATRTRIVLQGHHISILGTVAATKIARDALCDLIMGSPPGKVNARLRTAAQRANAMG